MSDTKPEGSTNQAAPKQIRKPTRQPPTEIGKITNLFLGEIRSLQFAHEETSKVLSASLEKHLSAFTSFLNSFETEKKGTQIKIAIPVEKAEKLKRLVHDAQSSALSLPLAHRGLFLVLVSKWDAYFGSLLRWVYRVRPEIIDGSARTISFAELKRINSIDDARNRIVEDEVGVVLRESHADQFAYLEKKLSLALTKIDIWPAFIELTQRRNLIAHADGKVSEQYLKVCRDHNVELSNDTTVGSDLEISTQYLKESCDYLAEMGFKLSQVLRRKLDGSNSGDADSHLIETTFQMLKSEQYKLAIRLLTFAFSPPMKFGEARDRYVCLVNLALAHKWMNNEKKCAEILDAEDWSAVPLDLKLALAVLRDNFDEAVSLMKKIGPSGDVTKADYEEWPLFNKFRNTKRFISTYREIFGTEFEVRDVPSQVTSALATERRTKKKPSKKRIAH